MAKNLLKTGHAVTCYNRSAGPRDELAEAGATIAATPKEAAAGAEVVITIVTDSPDVEHVILGPDGVAEGAAPGTVVVDMSTISPEVTRRIGAALAEQGVKMLDAPVSGGDAGAIAGTLSIMVGGDAAACERAAPIFQALGRQVTYMGGPGQGQMTKLVNQVVGATTLAAVAEGVLLAARAGLDPAAMVRALDAGAASSWMLRELAPRMQRGDFAPGFMVRLQQKDLRLALSAAAQLGVQLPTTAVVHLLFSAVEAQGGQDLGTQSLVKALEALSAKKDAHAPP
jgi:3-hydroxyisobutyrate dehydrogenase-like beta-hydroxyacid dehydrogenase